MIIEDARKIIKEKRYKIISDNMLDVCSNNVHLVVKKGRSVLLCSCTASSRFADVNLCVHKCVFIILGFNEKLYNQIDSSIKEVEKYKKLDLPMSNLLCLDILEKIKKVK
jgi:hypothetical protein